MKAPLLILLAAMSLSASAQTADTIYQQACGPKAAKFNVQLVSGQPPAAPEPGKALVYFIQDESGYFITKVGLDGAWVGAIERNSYLFATVAPGEHHACAMWQKNLGNAMHPAPHFAHFTAEAGKVYYYLIHSVDANVAVEFLELGPVDHDEALFKISSDSQSVAKPKP